MKKEQVKDLALANGFKLKEQPDGALDLNPYVYEFANSIEKVIFAYFCEKIRSQTKYFLRSPEDLLQAVENEIFKNEA